MFLTVTFLLSLTNIFCWMTPDFFLSAATYHVFIIREERGGGSWPSLTITDNYLTFVLPLNR